MGVAAQNLYSQQGIGGFYRGIEANVMRAMVLNGTKMSCYDQIKVSAYFDIENMICIFVWLPFPFLYASLSLAFNSLSPSLSLFPSLFLTLFPSLSFCLFFLLIFILLQGLIVKSQAIPAGLPTQFCAAFGAGFFMACTVAPFDMVREKRIVRKRGMVEFN